MSSSLSHLTAATRRLMVALSAGLAAILAAVLGFGAIAHASTSSPRNVSAKPTIVLVHGGWDNSSGWDTVIAKLQKQGYPVIAPADPLRDLASDSAYISSVLDTIKGPIVLVGHSYGGAVVTNAAVAHPNVKALVYIAGWALDQGESIGQLITKYPGSLIGPATTIGRPFPNPDGTQGTDLYLTMQGVKTAFAADVAPKVQAQIFATQRPFTEDAFNSVSGVPAWETIRHGTSSRPKVKAIPPATQLFMANRAGSHITKVRSSHVAMYSHPNSVVDTILDAVHSTY